jgi:hypothetical protein
MKRLTNSADFVHVAGALILNSNDFRNWDGYIPLIVDRISKCGYPRTDIGDAESRRPHVHAPASGTQIQRNSDNIYRFQDKTMLRLSGYIIAPGKDGTLFGRGGAA